jgi:hypothetical protein
MRMWMVDPKILCQKHLFGEHTDCHLFLSYLNKGNKIDGYIKNNLLDMKSLWQRHLDLSKEMTSRGYNHKSPIEIESCKFLENYPKEQQCCKVDADLSLKHLILRCVDCYANYKSQEIKENQTVSLELNIKSDVYTENGRIYPNGLLEKSINELLNKNKKIFIFDSAEYPPLLKNLIGCSYSFEIKDDNSIVFDCKLFRQTLMEVKDHLELTPFGFANIDGDNIVQKNYKINHLILLPKKNTY